MRKTFATTLGLVLMAGSVAFASQAPSTKLSQAATAKPPSTTSGSTKKHKKHQHHKKQTTPKAGSTGSTAKQ